MQLCPSCGAKQDELTEVKEGVWYCPHCDETYAVSKGKPVVQEQPKNLLTAMAERIKKIEQKQETTDEMLQGKKGMFGGMFDHLF